MNQEFPGFLGDRYLVAPYWDDVDIRGGRGVISYEIHTNGYYLDLVNNFLRQTRPSLFTGTWMAVVTWDAVQPFGAFFPEVSEGCVANVYFYTYHTCLHTFYPLIMIYRRTPSKPS